MRLLRPLLARGFFPKELPNVFTTSDFGLHALDIRNEWKTGNLFKIKPIKKASGRYSYTDLWETECESISAPKRGYERRAIQVTHPIPQTLLCHEIATHWRTVAKWLCRQKYSLDRIDISERHSRGVQQIDFRLHETKKDFIEATSDWLVRTDITRFYPSIYTHSIAWAAYGKEKVKRDLRKYSGTLADRLDVLVRACNRNQTIGIPIGPETSRILAEIVSSRIDYMIDQSTYGPSHKVGDRLQDDWFVGTRSLSEAERLLSLISSTYRQYGLDINGSKTSVQHILSRDKRSWTSEISLFLMNSARKPRKSALKDFLNLVLKTQATFPSERVVSYAISILEGMNFSPNDSALVESFLLEAAVVSPGSMDRICSIIINAQNAGATFSKERIRDRLLELCERHLENGNGFEAMWIIYTLRGLKIGFASKAICGHMERFAGATIPLILLDMRARGIFKGSLPVDDWEKQITADRIRSDWMWLLAYEGIRHGWLKDRMGVMLGNFFEPMMKRGVVFYDPSKNVTRSAKVYRYRSKTISKSKRRSDVLLADLRGMWNLFSAHFSHPYE